MNNTSVSISINFALINQSINRYAPIPLLLFGIIGNILNILVFTRKIFRNNICVIYFLSSTIFDSFVIVISLFPRLLLGFNIDPTQNSSVLCKLRFFITYYSGYSAAWFIGLACIERYLCSSIDIYKRQLVTMKRAYLSIIVVMLLGIFIYGEQFYCIDIHQQLFGAPQSCYQLKRNIRCQIVDSLMQFLFEILAPTLMMIIFGSLTLRNIRHRRNRRCYPAQTNNSSTRNPSSVIQQLGNPRNVVNNQRIKRRDIQLVTMLLVQVIVFVISTFPISIYKLYSIGTIHETKSKLRQSIENTIFNISVITLFLNNIITFYINTLCGTIFRKELIRLFRPLQQIIYK
ncbi:unnamed protein product [Adineta steineri]|uniref:G-protein coupled receptors family 1 profile domain-containing protein n=1 Tax=Adineta steineri TaxID=433720 RepID=A0A814K1S9_9BILA|nr:unnamed protein product [Adineta steineri]CAF1121420.1 unnamed protein product [Adineta steineri]